MTAQDVGDVDPTGTLARAELDRVVRDLVAQREPVRDDTGEGSLAAFVAQRDAQLWAEIASRGSTDE